jgi:cholesterol transport system auxiliary component
MKMIFGSRRFLRVSAAAALPAVSGTDIPRRAMLAACSVFLALGGCAGTARNKMPAAVYDFGPPVQSAEEAPDRPARRLALDVSAAPWLDGPGIDYRLAYADPFERSQYADSRWAAPPASLLAAQLRRRIGFVAVDVAADCVLRVELQEFSQVFTEPRISHGVAQGQASLIDGKRRLIASRAFGIQRPARAPDAAGGVQALVEAGDELGRQLDAWLIQLDRENGLKSCRSEDREQRTEM